MVRPDARRMASPRHVDCDHSGSSGRALLSVHPTSAGTVSYLRCSCGVWLVLQEGELLAVVARENIRAPAAIFSVTGHHTRHSCRDQQPTATVCTQPHWRRQQGGAPTKRNQP